MLIYLSTRPNLNSKFRRKNEAQNKGEKKIKREIM
jgi:hypothetical protein